MIFVVLARESVYVAVLISMFHLRDPDLQAYYPERLGKVYALHIPQLFWAFWKLVHPFLDDVTKAKISFVEDDKIEETLLKDISLEEIPTLYGGSKELVPLELAQPPGWPQFKPVT